MPHNPINRTIFEETAVEKGNGFHYESVDVWVGDEADSPVTLQTYTGDENGTTVKLTDAEVLGIVQTLLRALLAKQRRT